MEAKIVGLKLFRNSLYKVAARSLWEKHPQYAKTLIQTLAETGDLSQALNAVKTIPTDVGFAKWRPLLTATFDTELAINQVKTALDLLAIIPPRRIVIPKDILISEGAWVCYHMNAWIFLMDALLERTRKLISRAVRLLIRPRNLNYQGIENDILKPINELSKDLRDRMRNALAHGGWPVEAVTEEELWEGMVLIATLTNRYELFSNQIFEPMSKYHTRWHQQLDKKSGIVLIEIDRAMTKLNKHIDWDKI